MPKITAIDRYHSPSWKVPPLPQPIYHVVVCYHEPSGMLCEHKTTVLHHPAAQRMLNSSRLWDERLYALPHQIDSTSHTQCRPFNSASYFRVAAAASDALIDETGSFAELLDLFTAIVCARGYRLLTTCFKLPKPSGVPGSTDETRVRDDALCVDVLFAATQ